MKQIVCAAFAAVLLSATSAFAEDAAGLAQLDWLLGDWAGNGKGTQGDSSADRHAEKVLDGQFVQLAGRTTYPPSERNPKGRVHVQTDIWGYDRSRKALTLRQLDGLGLACMYILDTQASTSTRWVLNAEHLENVPKGWRIRYIYTLKSPNEYEEVFELDNDGTGFKPLFTNQFKRAGAGR